MQAFLIPCCTVQAFGFYADDLCPDNTFVIFEWDLKIIDLSQSFIFCELKTEIKTICKFGLFFTPTEKFMKFEFYE